ncbi:hypothetical protein NTP67_14575 [Providencia rettgeri]|uniref:hypothetical protein n=1 Tax=Providencia rettgeri TaxID=587 RepID=UPI00221E9469|nr:hypothetical protein [Providencia rettgeri]ELR5279853.1 hypothetical protein [Providencia rettgeri]UYV40449.1 hypothetical protein NTP67_14575 [Providencia rettgeri]
MTAQELIEMTPEQQRAFNRFEKAANDFKKAGGMFYTVLHKIHGLNGKYVESIEADYLSRGKPDGDLDTQLDVSMDCISDSGFSGFADDTHMIKLTGEGLALLNEED